jgi:hypothetical protein
MAQFTTRFSDVLRQATRTRFEKTWVQRFRRAHHPSCPIWAAVAEQVKIGTEYVRICQNDIDVAPLRI